MIELFIMVMGMFLGELTGTWALELRWWLIVTPFAVFVEVMSG